MCSVIVDSIDIKNRFPSVFELGISTHWYHDFKDEKVIFSLLKCSKSCRMMYLYYEIVDLVNI